MAKNSNPKVQSAPTLELQDDEDALDVQIDAALKVSSTQAEAEQQVSAREAAALEEKLQAQRIAEARAAREQAQRIAEARAAREQAAKAPEPVDEPLISLAAKGREHLLQKLREHAEKPKPEYVPPPMTDRMRKNIEAEMEAGRRAVMRHAEQQANRPVPPKEPWDGTSTPVFRPSTAVPDPTVSAPSGFAAGSATYDPKA